ncbi:fasciclin domain-containing protein [Amycolatopsis cihanbeyliensis]|uniref:Putative surface protein with fasciclin (FAS1) repeats n=1 Tax=Amycolatopsis cihanbeyliensis TaxID=1128664 RepID=A0A542DHX8_AMYCI|nr:fasciclin domain-containing protein [Amycolatopsis cihanbeyliensis]TQJ02660.1 putative surface protein with fasciclin (FAS1) repeats [Amycolatopsis cihanbeyliensis]
MHVRKTRFAATGAVAAMALLLSACGGDDQASDSGQDQDTQSPSPTSEQTTSSPTASNGMTTADDVYGPGCAQVPTDPSDEGSVQGMIDDPVGTAASNNPLLTSLTKAVKTAGLVDTLNKSDASYTVFAPANPAFEALPKETLNALLTDESKKQQLTDILTYHVVPERMDAQGVVDAGSLETVQGGSLTVEGSGQDFTVNGAKVLCGNVPTANATVFVIDKVMMPES